MEDVGTVNYLLGQARWLACRCCGQYPKSTYEQMANECKFSYPLHVADEKVHHALTYLNNLQFVSYLVKISRHGDMEMIMMLYLEASKHARRLKKVEMSAEGWGWGSFSSTQNHILRCSNVIDRLTPTEDGLYDLTQKSTFPISCIVVSTRRQNQTQAPAWQLAKERFRTSQIHHWKFVFFCS